jgi:hypothetical protein
MNNIISDINFKMSKNKAIEKGKIIRRRFMEQIERLTKIKGGEKFNHSYIYSPPGIGKTFSIKKHLEGIQTNYVQVSGNVSMYAFGIQLAVINYLNKERETIIVFVDDCDVLFSTEANCNTMKNVLDGSKLFTYEKSLQSQWTNLSDIQKDAVRHHQSENKMGFEVPTENMVFIFTSNFKLPVDDDIRLLRNKSTSRSILLSHKNAIRSRCNVGDYDLSDAELWGWITDVIITTDCLRVYETKDNEKVEILNFLWDNWNNLTERSIRLVEKMALIIKENPSTYRTIWEIDFLK